MIQRHYTSDLTMILRIAKFEIKRNSTKYGGLFDDYKYYLQQLQQM